MALLLHHLLFYGIPSIPKIHFSGCHVVESLIVDALLAAGNLAKNSCAWLTKWPVLTSHCTSCALLQESPKIIN